MTRIMSCTEIKRQQDPAPEAKKGEMTARLEAAMKQLSNIHMYGEDISYLSELQGTVASSGIGIETIKYAI